MPEARDLPSQDELLEILSYDPETGLLRWKHRPNGSPQWNGKHAGQIAGNISKSNGRIVLHFGKRLYLAHRVIWKMVYGEDAPEIDHEDTDETNNRLRNLRRVTHDQNMQNASRHGGKALPKGVTVRKRSGRFRADIYLDGRCQFLGEFDDPDLAHAAYCAAAAVRGEFARFD